MKPQNICSRSPILFNYWLTGNAVCEFTNATTTQMVDPVKRTWATGLMQRLELPSHLPAPIVEPGSIIGTLLPGVAGHTALAGTTVIAPACHDTGSAVAAVSARDGTAFLSSGTWSLLGTELDSPVITSEALRLNFTNEGGVNGTTRLLKNVMGLWMLQGCRQSWSTQGYHYDYRELMELATRKTAFRHLVDPDDESFLRPTDMPAAISQFCTRTHQPVPQQPGAYVRAVLESLAFKYRLVLRNLEHVSGKRIDQIRIIGGGSKNRLLNQLTADATGRKVFAGPAEATALGNVAIQILATGAAGSLRKFAPSWTDLFRLKCSSRSKPTSGTSTRNDLSNIAGVFMPEIKETTHLKDLWNEAEAQKLAGNQLALLRYRSNLLGADLRITNFGGGNTSSKMELPDPFTGRPVRVLAVKGSGGDLGSITDAGFALLYLDRLEQLKELYRGEQYEDEMVRYYPLSAFGENRVAASIDTPLHAFLPFAHVDHLHPDWAIALAASANGKRKLGEFNKEFGRKIVWVPWQRPGFELALMIERDSQRQSRQPKA